MIQETWRAQREEDAGRKRGVGILLRSRWRATVTKLRLLFQRLASLHLATEGQQVRLLVAYVLHGGHTEDDVEALYAAVAKKVEEGRKPGATVIDRGDFNAEVGAAHDEWYLGWHGRGTTNS